MARLAAIEKALFYPTGTNIIELFADTWQPKFFGSKKPQQLWVDPCCGEGEAVAYLRDMWQDHVDATIYGIELDQGRAEKAQKVLDQVINAPAQQVEIPGLIDFLFMNPPYDTYRGTRAEIAWLNLWLPKVTEYSGNALLVLPDMFVEGGRYARSFATILNQHRFVVKGAHRYPDPDYALFKQVVILLSKRPRYGYFSDYTNGIPLTDILHRTTQANEFIISNGSPHVMMYLRPEQPAEGVLTEEYALSKHGEFFGSPLNGFSSLRPAMPLSVEHAGVVAAAGLLDNTEVDGVLVRGATSKETIVTDTTDENGVATTIEQQVTVAHLLFLHSGGKLEHYQSRGDTEKEFGDAIVKWAPVFVEKVQNDYASPFDSRVSERLSKDLFWVRAPKKLEGWPDTLRPEQIERAAAILHGWKRNPVMTLVGEMGVGKTAIGAAAAIEKARRRREGLNKIVMFIPAKEDLALKMPAEIEIVARELDVWAVEVKTISDVNAAFQRKGVGILILRETTAKQSSGWKAVQMMRSRLGGWRCPACGEPAYHTNGKLDDNGDLVMIDEPEKMHTVCSECSTQMWQAARYRNGNKTVLPSFGDWDTYVSEWKAIAANAESVNAALLAKGSHLPISDWALANQNPWAFLKTPEPFGSAKWPLAKYISTRYPRCYILIIDEAHNTKEMDTDVGLAAYRLLANAKATLQMTGTLYGGVASSIFMLMYRAIPEFRKFYDYSDRAKFVNDHGLMAKISKTYPEKTETGFSGEDRVFTRYEELPGITPEIVVRLLESTVFIKQSDMTRAFDIAMRQYLVLVDVPETKPDAAKHLASVRETAIKEMMDKEAPDKTLFGNYLQMRTGIWDMLWKGDSAGGRYHYPAQQPGPIGMFPKEEALMRIVLDNAKKKRPVLIYIPQINARDATPWLSDLFARYGLKLSVMRANIKNRGEFIKYAIRNGANAIACSPELVKEGVDLVITPTIIWYGGIWNNYVMAQASYRAFRFHQKHDCEVWFVGYADTDQANLFARMSKKLGGMQALQGTVREGLAELLGDPDDLIARIQGQVARSLSKDTVLTLADLPSLPPTASSVPAGIDNVLTGSAARAAQSQVDVQVMVQTSRPARVQVTVQIEDLNAFEQLSLF